MRDEWITFIKLYTTRMRDEGLNIFVVELHIPRTKRNKTIEMPEAEGNNKTAIHQGSNALRCVRVNPGIREGDDLGEKL
jgi:hypothetical protein